MSVVDDIKQRLDIVQLVSEYVDLQKSGRNFKASCPFHAEKSPSFFVFPERQSWHCFGACGTGGDIFSFIMKKEGLDFGQALRLLAEKAGVTLVAQSSPQKQAEDKERDRLFQLNEAVMEYYHHLLLESSEGETARDYVSQRGLSPETVANFKLGFSPEGWESLRQYLMGKGYSEANLLAASLVIGRDGGGSYDRFRNRLMFPIQDMQGNVLGFGARALDESMPKYINSAQTLIFDKSSILYGISRAKTAIRQKDQVIIVEGYMDVLMAHQHGWENTVASMGTALTERQFATLKKLTRNLVLALDADAAGKEAVLRSEEVLGRALDKKVIPEPTRSGLIRFENALDADIKVIVPVGKDPDEVIREDASKWQELVTGAKPMIDFAFDTVVAKIDLGSAKDKSSAVEKVLPLLSEIKDPIRRGHYTHKLALLLKINETYVDARLSQFQATERKRRINKSFHGLTPAAHTIASSRPLEEYCLALLLQYPGLKTEAMKLSPDYFEHSENRELLLKWQQSNELASLQHSLDSTLHQYLESLLAKTLPPTLKDREETQRQTLRDCMNRLQERWLKSQEAKKEELLATEAETGGVTAQLAKLEEQGIEESKQLREVFIKQGHQRQRIASSKEE